MFGHQDDQHHHHDDDHKTEDVLSQPAVDSVLSTEHHEGTTVHDDGFNPAAPADDAVFAPSAPAAVDDQATPAAVPATDEAPVVAAPAADSDLLGIKQQVLTSLSPLVDHLDQTPEEKFRTTMMMIQASDNQALIKNAYEAAQAIEDEKVKAQALLDIVNEINYFTTQQPAA